MAYDFKKLMSPELRKRHEAKIVEIDRLYQLPDRWLGRELMTLARNVRASGVFGDGYPDYSVAQSALFWDLIPEITSRMGETVFQPAERPLYVRRMDDQELRARVSELIWSDRVIARTFDDRLFRDFNPYLLLVNDACNGNPVAIGLDRFAAVSEDAPDKIGDFVFQIADRRGHEASFYWRPEFNESRLPADFYVAPVPVI
jgi:hypothetical protein